MYFLSKGMCIILSYDYNNTFRILVLLLLRSTRYFKMLFLVILNITSNLYLKSFVLMKSKHILLLYMFKKTPFAATNVRWYSKYGRFMMYNTDKLYPDQQYILSLQQGWASVLFKRTQLSCVLFRSL